MSKLAIKQPEPKLLGSRFEFIIDKTKDLIKRKTVDSVNIVDKKQTGPQEIIAKRFRVLYSDSFSQPRWAWGEKELLYKTRNPSSHNVHFNPQSARCPQN